MDHYGGEIEGGWQKATPKGTARSAFRETRKPSKQRTIRRGWNKGDGPWDIERVYARVWGRSPPVAQKGWRRGISGCSFCKYLKSRRVAGRERSAPRRAGCTMEFSILCREIALINETAWPLETLFVTACGRCVARATGKTWPR